MFSEGKSDVPRQKINHRWNQMFCGNGVCELNVCMHLENINIFDFKSTIDWYNCAEGIYNVDGGVVFYIVIVSSAFHVEK